MFHVELAPLGGTFGPLKSDLGVFWPFRATDFIMGILKIWDNFLGPQLPILKFTFLESLRNLWLFGINKKDGRFFSITDPFRTHMCQHHPDYHDYPNCHADHPDHDHPDHSQRKPRLIKSFALLLESPWFNTILTFRRTTTQKRFDVFLFECEMPSFH